MSSVTFVWSGDRVEERVERAIGRSQVGWGEDIVAGMKTRVHRLTGTLSRSLHTAKANYDGGSDEGAARAGGQVINSGPDKPDGGKSVIEAGSWISYAIYEFARGGEHDFGTEAAQQANGRYPALLEKAMQEEGLK